MTDPDTSIDPGVVALMADLRGPTIPFLAWRAGLQMLSGSDPVGDMIGWLSDYGYDLDLTQMGASIAGIRSNVLATWAGVYHLFDPESDVPLILAIAVDGSVSVNNRPVADATFTAGRLDLTLPDGGGRMTAVFSDHATPFESALLAPDDEPTGDTAVLACLDGLRAKVSKATAPGVSCAATLVAPARSATDAPTPRTDITRTLSGTTGIFSSAAALAGATTDDLATWNGVYTLYLQTSPGTYAVSDIRMTVAAAPGKAIAPLVAGGTAITFDTAVTDTSLTWNSNTLTWTKDGHGQSVSFLKDGAGTARASGTVTLGTGTAATPFVGVLTSGLPGSDFAIVTVNLPDAIAGSDYRAILEAAPSTASVTWTVATGKLPEGLKLEGNQITGKPTTSGVASFIVTATSTSTGAISSRALSINVTPDASSFSNQASSWASTITSIAAFLGSIAVPFALYGLSRRDKDGDDQKTDQLTKATGDLHQELVKAAKAATNKGQDLAKLTGLVSDLTKALKAESEARAALMADRTVAAAAFDAAKKLLADRIAEAETAAAAARDAAMNATTEAEEERAVEEAAAQELWKDQFQDLKERLEARFRELGDAQAADEEASDSEGKSESMAAAL